VKGMHSFSSFLQGATFHSAIKIAESGGIKTETPEQTVTAPLAVWVHSSSSSSREKFAAILY